HAAGLRPALRRSRPGPVLGGDNTPAARPRTGGRSPAPGYRAHPHGRRGGAATAALTALNSALRNRGGPRAGRIPPGRGIMRSTWSAAPVRARKGMGMRSGTPPAASRHSGTMEVTPELSLPGLPAMGLVDMPPVFATAYMVAFIET